MVRSTVKMAAKINRTSSRCGPYQGSSPLHQMKARTSAAATKLPTPVTRAYCVRVRCSSQRRFPFTIESRYRVTSTGTPSVWPVPLAGAWPLRCPIRQNAPVLLEWLWRGGRFRMPVAYGVYSGILMGAFFYLLVLLPLGTTARAVGAVIGGAGAGLAFGIVVAVSPTRSSWLRYGQLSGLPPSDRVAVLRAVREGERASDPRLAPGVLAWAEVVVASARRQQDQHMQWRMLALGVVSLVLALTVTTTGSVGVAVAAWAAAAWFLGMAWWLRGALERRRAKAQAAADFAAGQIGR